MNYTDEMIAKAKTAASAAELQAMAKEYNIELSESEASEYFDFLNGIHNVNEDGMQELSSVELEIVAGGKGGRPDPKYKAGQRVVFRQPGGVPLYGWITGSSWVEFQKAYYYDVGMENGEKMTFPLEDPYCPTKVIS